MIPTDLSGCTVWLDASQLTGTDGSSIGSQWADLSGNGNHGAVVGSPAPVVKTNVLAGKRVVRFAADQGRIRGDGMVATSSSDLTVIYLARTVGPVGGRIFTNIYPSYNFLVGTHVSGEPQMYDNGWVGNNYAFTGFPTPWRMYGAVCTMSPTVRSEFWLDGVLRAFHGLSNGHDSKWNLSGYSTGTEETCDCEVAELICYDRALSTTERQAVENYLNTKWINPPVSVPVSVAFSSTGQLFAGIEESSGTGPVSGGDGWTAEPDPPPPPRRYGPSWTTTSGVPARTVVSTWFALLEKVASLSGDGTLNALISPHIATKGVFGSEGVLSPDLLLRNYCAMPLSGSGMTVGSTYRIVVGVLADFASSGSFAAASINDGLSGSMTGQYPAYFSGGGNLSHNVVGGSQYYPGLTAVLVQRYLFPSVFSGVGELLIFSGAVRTAFVNLIGSGALTASNVNQVYSLMSQLAADGTLSAQTFAAYQKVVNLLGSGTLSATAFTGFITSLGVSGAGAFTALLLASYQRPVGGGGVGTMGIALFARYTFASALTGAGTMNAPVVQVYSQAPVLSGSGSLKAGAVEVRDGLVAAVYSAGG